MLTPANLLELLKELVKQRGADVISQTFTSKIVDVVIHDERYQIPNTWFRGHILPRFAGVPMTVVPSKGVAGRSRRMEG